MLGISVDITEQKRAARELQRKLEQMQVLSSLAKAVNLAQEPAEIYRAAVHGLTRAVGADRRQRADLRPGRRDAIQGMERLVGRIPGGRDRPHALAARRARCAAHRRSRRPRGLLAFQSGAGVCEGRDSGRCLHSAAGKRRSDREVHAVLQPAARVSGGRTADRSNHRHPCRRLQPNGGMRRSALRDSEELFRATFFQAAVGITQANLAGKLRLVNDRICEILGYSRAELLDKTFLEITHPDHRETCVRAIRRTFDGRNSVVLHGETLSPQERQRRLGAGECVAGTRSERPAAIFHRRGGRHYRANPGGTRASGKRAAADTSSERNAHWAFGTATCGRRRSRCLQRMPSFLGAPRTYAEWLALIHPDDRERVWRSRREGVARKQSWEAEFRVLLPDGSVRWLLTKAAVLLDEAGEATRLVGVSLDITERKQAETALRESEELFRNLADTAPVMMWMSGADKLCTFFNKTWLSFTGRTLEQELGNGWAEGIHPDDAERCYASYCSAFDARRDFHIEYRHAPRGRGVPMAVVQRSSALRPWRRLCRLHRLRHRYHRSQARPGGGRGKTEAGEPGRADQRHRPRLQQSAGQRPGGRGTGGVGGCRRCVSGFEQIQRIKAVAVRAAEIVRELMIYSGQDQADLGSVDLSRLVEEMLELLKVSISKHAVLKTDLRKNLPAVRGNAAQIRQIVMNLIINASEALGEKDGVIHVTTSLRRQRPEPVLHFRHEPARGRLPLPVGFRYRLRDRRKSSRPRIFDPFFTTKFAGRGLGLAVVHGIVRAHAGAIHLSSTPGQGTTFQIFLPCGRARRSRVSRSPRARFVRRKPTARPPLCFWWKTKKISALPSPRCFPGKAFR